MNQEEFRRLSDLVERVDLKPFDYTNPFKSDKSKSKLTGDEYIKLANRTSDPDINNKIFDWMRECIANDIEPGHLMYGCLGLSGEVGEFVDLIKKSIFHKTPFNEVHAKRELGDICWYIQEICNAFGWSLNEIFEMNLEKTNNRYPNGFNVDDANNRNGEDI